MHHEVDRGPAGDSPGGLTREAVPAIRLLEDREGRDIPFLSQGKDASPTRDERHAERLCDAQNRDSPESGAINARHGRERVLRDQ